MKWVGGKTQLQGEINPVIPKHFNNYYEPFLGGASTLINVLEKIKHGQLKCTGKIHASDLNPFLIGFYIHVRDNTESLLEEISILFKEYNSCKGSEFYKNPITKSEAMVSKQSYYYWVRDNFNRNFEHVKRCGTNQSVYVSAMFYFMNKTCFRGLYRESKNGFNVPFGNYVTDFKINKDHFNNISLLLKKVGWILAWVSYR